MVEQARTRRNGISLQAGPSEMDNESLLENNRRVVQLIGHQLAQIGDELEFRWFEKQTNRRQNLLNGPPNTFAQTRSVISGILGNLWRAKISPSVKTSWLVPKFHSEMYQKAMQWTAWVSNVHFADWPSWTTGLLVSAMLLATAAVFTALWDDIKN